MHAGYLASLQVIDTTMQAFGLDDNKPLILHHYTSLDAALNILKNREIWLFHSEYLNDSSEIGRSISLIKNRIERRIDYAKNISHYRVEEQFFSEVMSKYDSKTSLHEAFIFCMSEGHLTGLNRQDVLSAWRAYGKDGRGVCLSFDSGHFTVPRGATTGTRLSRVIYDERLQEKILDSILDEGFKLHSSMSNTQEAVDVSVAALVFMMPVLKHTAFSEEREWRFIYLPENQDPTASKMRFHIRNELLIPFYTAQDALDDPSGAPAGSPPINRTPIPVEIMIGPSVQQQLNLRSFEFLRGRAVLRTSGIPYRS